MWKKSLILSSKGNNLNELNENETFVKRIVCVCATPTVKSYKLKSVRKGIECTICMATNRSLYQTWVKYLENNFVRF